MPSFLRLLWKCQCYIASIALFFTMGNIKSPDATNSGCQPEEGIWICSAVSFACTLWWGIMAWQGDFVFLLYSSPPTSSLPGWCHNPRQHHHHLHSKCWWCHNLRMETTGRRWSNRYKQTMQKGQSSYFYANAHSHNKYREEKERWERRCVLAESFIQKDIVQSFYRRSRWLFRLLPLVSGACWCHVIFWACRNVMQCNKTWSVGWGFM